ncbi:tyrosine-type recombinase/integrase [Candidatus Bipolaricaulota bacterium]
MSSIVEPFKDINRIGEIKQLLSSEPVCLLAFALGINCPLRIDMLLSLRNGDVFTPDARVRETLEVYDGKKRQRRRIVLGAGARKALREHLAQVPSACENLDGWLFPSIRKGKRISRQQIWRVLKAAAESVGATGHYGTDSLRKTWGYWVWTRHGRVDLLQREFGARSILDLWRFLGITRDEVSQAYSKSVEARDIVHLGEYSQLAQEVIRHVLQIDRARSRSEEALPSVGGRLVSPYREAMRGVFGLYNMSCDWESNRQAVLERTGGTCTCGELATHIHHMSYANWASGPAELADLVPLCRSCHPSAHAGGGPADTPFWAKRTPDSGYITDEMLSALHKDFSL